VLNGVEIKDFWVQLATALAVISMTVGNGCVGAAHIKRLLAYSSIAQAGYDACRRGGAASDSTCHAGTDSQGQEQAVAAIIFTW
jgi:NADH:ubiquinone oxidoreductase subunit 4 (subunit M)